MTAKRIRWMAAVGAVLGMPWLSCAQEIVWRAVIDSLSSWPPEAESSTACQN